MMPLVSEAVKYSVRSRNRVRTYPGRQRGRDGGRWGDREHCRSNREKRRAIHSLSETESKLRGADS